MSSMLMMLQEQAGDQQIQMAREVVIAIIVATTLMVVALLFLIWSFARITPTETGPLRYGNFFVVIFGIMTVLIGFLVAFPLVVSRVFEDPTQVIALLSALFGTIVGLVGTYFGVKSSSDAGDRAQSVVQDFANSRLGLPNTPAGGGSGGGGSGGGGGSSGGGSGGGESGGG